MSGSADCLSRGKPKLVYFWRRTKNLSSCSIPPPGPTPSPCPLSLPVAASTRGGFMGFVGGFMGQNVRSGGGLLCRGPWQERYTDARPGSKPRTTHPVHLWLIKCTEAGPGWSPVPARLGLCGTPLRTSLRHACDSFPARFQLVSSSFPARFQLVSSSFPACFQLVSSSFPARFQLSSQLSCFSSWKSVKDSLNFMNSAEFTEGSSA